jgi:hypothetical protein
MTVFVSVQPIQSIADSDTSPNDLRLQVPWSYFDTVAKHGVSNSCNVIVNPADNAQAVETKIRDAVIADVLAVAQAVVSPADVFQAALRRG